MKPLFSSWSCLELKHGQWLTTLMLLLATVASAQDSLRSSMAGDAAAEAARQQMASEGYTLKSGDFRLFVAPSVGIDWNDNVNLSKVNAESDFILEPSLQLTGSYPVTQANLLSLSVGIGYQDYLHYDSLSRLDLTSGSQISFNMFIKDFSINVHDFFSMTDNSSSEAAVAGTALYGTFVNTAGLATTWDLKDLVLTLGYDHQNTLSTFGQFSYLDHTSELPLARAGFHLRPDLTAGLEASASFTTYDQPILNNNNSYSIGAYADWSPGAFFHLQPRAGFTVYQFQHTSRSAQIFNYTLSGVPIIAPGNETIQTSDLNSWYADLTLSHDFSRVATLHLSAGHEIQLGIQSDAVEDWYFRPNINWTIIKNVALNTSLWSEHGSQGVGNVAGDLTETFDWFVGGLSASYPLMKNLNVSVNYQLTLRSSNLASAEYAQNMVGLDFTYQVQ